MKSLQIPTDSVEAVMDQEESPVPHAMVWVVDLNRELTMTTRGMPSTEVNGSPVPHVPVVTPPARPVEEMVLSSNRSKILL